MRWSVLLEIGLGLVPSTVFYVGGFAVLLGTLLGLVLTMISQGVSDLLLLLLFFGGLLAAGPMLLPLLWKITWFRFRHGRPANLTSRQMTMGLAGGALMTVLLLTMLVESPEPLNLYLLGAPLALAVRELALRLPRSHLIEQPH